MALAKNQNFITKLYEPSELKAEPVYINLRRCLDISLLRSLEQRLLTEDPKNVIVPWVGQSFGTIEGYGVYAPQEVKQLRERAQKEFVVPAARTEQRSFLDSATHGKIILILLH